MYTSTQIFQSEVPAPQAESSLQLAIQKHGFDDISLVADFGVLLGPEEWGFPLALSACSSTAASTAIKVDTTGKFTLSDKINLGLGFAGVGAGPVSKLLVGEEAAYPIDVLVTSSDATNNIINQ